LTGSEDAMLSSKLRDILAAKPYTYQEGEPGFLVSVSLTTDEMKKEQAYLRSAGFETTGINFSTDRIEVQAYKAPLSGFVGEAYNVDRAEVRPGVSVLGHGGQDEYLDTGTWFEITVDPDDPLAVMRIWVGRVL
jgi:hypothetical protein